MNTEPCWICGYGPHAPTELHIYTTEAEALAYFATIPDAVPPPIVVDGVSYSYGS